jgi:hypothetical protein
MDCNEEKETTMFKTKRDQQATIDRLTEEVEALVRSRGRDRESKEAFEAWWHSSHKTTSNLILAVEKAWADGIIDHDRGGELYDLAIESWDALKKP